MGTIGLAMEIITGELCAVKPLSVALTKRPTVPTVVPAVKFADAPVVMRVPIARFVRDHEYAMLDGQIVLHAGVAVKF